MSDNLDPTVSVTNERLGEVVSDLKSEMSNLNTEITTNLNISMKESMREMFKEFLGNREPKIDLPPVENESEKVDILPSSVLVNVDGKAKANPETTDAAEGNSIPRKPGVYPSVPPGQVYNSIHQHVSPPHIANMGAPPMLDPKDFPNWQFNM